MREKRFFDQILMILEHGDVAAGVSLLAGKLFAAKGEEKSWPDIVRDLRKHPLHSVLMEDPYCSRSMEKPRGYAGDAVLIDFVYDRQTPCQLSDRAAAIFNVTTGFQAAQGVRNRREAAEDMLMSALGKEAKVCALACGHLREADKLAGKDITNIVAVDQDPLSLNKVRQTHGDNVTLVEANVIRYLRSAAAEGHQFDLIYTLGLTDYFDDRTMSLFHQLMKACLAPGGKIMLANFAPHHLAVGWMDAVMDWQLIYRDEADLTAYASAIGMQAKTWRDASDSIVFCEMA